MDPISVVFLVLFLFALTAAVYINRRHQRLLTEIKIDLARTQAELEAAKSTLDAERKTFESAKAQLSDTFKSLAASALEGNNRQFMDLAKTMLQQEVQVAKGDLEKRQTAINHLVQPLNEALKKYHEQVAHIETNRVRAFTSVEQEIKRVAEINGLLSEETRALKDALKRPHVRGRWGEVQLKNCVELAGMSEYSDVVFQDTQNTDDGDRIIPDMTVRMPGGRFVVVDAKTPIDAFMAYLDANTDEQRNLELSRHGRHVKDHIKKLSSRAYSDLLKESPDFTVMFLPNESFLYAALEADPELMEYAIEKKILIATPPTLIGLLKVIRFGWNEERLAENAERISDAGKELHKRICDFMDAYVGIGKHLEKARDEYEKGLSRLESRVLVQAQRLEKLGAKSKKSLPTNLNIRSGEALALEAATVNAEPEDLVEDDLDDTVTSAADETPVELNASGKKKRKRKKRKGLKKQDPADVGSPADVLSTQPPSDIDEAVSAAEGV